MEQGSEDNYRKVKVLKKNQQDEIVEESSEEDDTKNRSAGAKDEQDDWDDKNSDVETEEGSDDIESETETRNKSVGAEDEQDDWDDKNSDVETEDGSDDIESETEVDEDFDEDMDIANDEKKLMEEFLTDPQKFSQPIESFFALYHLQSNGTFRQAENVTQSFAHVKYMSKAIVLSEALKQSKGSRSKATSAVKEIAETILAPGIITPFNIANTYTSFISSFVKRNPSPPSMLVSDDGKELWYDGTKVVVPDLVDAVCQTIEEAEEEMHLFCQGHQEDWKVPDNIVDNWRETQRGYGLFKLETWVTNENSLWDSLQERYPFLVTFDETGDLVIDRALSESLLQSIEKIREKILIALYLATGQPPRISELVEHKFTNSIKPRTMFLSPGLKRQEGEDCKEGEFPPWLQFWLVIRRAKFSNIVGLEQFIPTLVPPRLAKLLCSYLCIMRPLELVLVQICWDSTAARRYSEYLFVSKGQYMSPSTFSRSIKSWFKKRLDISAGPRIARQVLVQIARLYIGSAFLLDAFDSNDALTLQQNHPQYRARQTYAPEYGHLPGLSSDFLAAYAKVSQAWWEIWGLRNGYGRRKPRFVEEQIVRQSLKEEIVAEVFQKLKMHYEGLLAAQKEQNNSTIAIINDLLTKNRYHHSMDIQLLCTPGSKWTIHIIYLTMMSILLILLLKLG
ncbi:hypothetical protein VKT23_013649 [Stygiomarasmius scandens]|uniref:Uncharacterized protein n=1 Tax=Marasmiellus scandens TaxID=2682957 RepID=A0ABR1J2Y9_9AGAR